MTAFSSLTWYDAYLALGSTFSITLPATSDGDLIVIGQTCGTLHGSSPLTPSQDGAIGWIICDGSESGGTVIYTFTSADLTRIASPTTHWSAVVVHYTSIQRHGAVSESTGLPSPSVAHVTGGGSNKAKVTLDFTRYTGIDGVTPPYTPISYFYFAQGRLSDSAALNSSVSGVTSRSHQQFTDSVRAVTYEMFDILNTDLDTVIASHFEAEAVAIAGGETAIAQYGELTFYDLIPIYDIFDNATDIFCGSTYSGETNVGATKEVGEPNHAGDAGGASVWYKLIPDDDATVTVSVVADFDALLAVYTGPDLASLVEVDSDSGASPSVTFAGMSGVTYWIAVDGAGGETGLFDISVDCVTVTTGSQGPYWGIKLSA